MRPHGSVATFTTRKRGEKLGDALAKIDWKAQDGAQLNHDGVHLPVATAETDVKKRLANSQVSCGADGQELRKALDDAEDDREQIVVQDSSVGEAAYLQLWLSDLLKHRVRVDAAWVVVFSCSLSTISVLFPEGNGGGVVGCRFKRYLLNAIRGERSLCFTQHHGA